MKEHLRLYTINLTRHAIVRNTNKRIMLNNGLRRRNAKMKPKRGKQQTFFLARSNNKACPNYIGNEDRKRDICTGRKGDGIAGGDVTMDDHIKS